MRTADSAPSASARTPGTPLAGAVAVVGALSLVALTLAHPSTSRMYTWPWAALAALAWLTPLVLLTMRVVTGAPLRLPDRASLATLTLLVAITVGSAWASPFG